MTSYTNSKPNKTLSYNDQFTKIQLSKFSTLIQVAWSQTFSLQIDIYCASDKVLKILFIPDVKLCTFNETWLQPLIDTHNHTRTPNMKLV